MAAEQEQIEELERENGQLRRENEQLQRRVKELERLLEEALRKLKRQAGPFARDVPTQNPRTPGRRAGERYGQHRRRRTPAAVHEEHAAKLPDRCAHCGGPLECDGSVEQYQEDIVRQTVQRLFHVEVGHCRRCGRRAQGRHRLQTSDAFGAASVQIGPEALALAAELHHGMGLAYGKAAAVLRVGYGLRIDRSTLCRAAARLAERAAPTYKHLQAELNQSPAVWLDETGWRLAGRPGWLHVAVTLRITVYHIDRRRGFAAAQHLVAASYRGVLGHDGWQPYYRYAAAVHQSCLSHLYRRCDAILMSTDPTQPPWFAGAVLDFLLRAFAIERRRRAGALHPHGQCVLLGRMEHALERLLAWPIENSPLERRLQKHLRHEAPYLLTFLYCPDAESTSNRAERAIRPAVVARKTWGGNRTAPGAGTQQVLMSVFATYRQQRATALPELAELLRVPKPFLLSICQHPQPP